MMVNTSIDMTKSVGTMTATRQIIYLSTYVSSFIQKVSGM